MGGGKRLPSVILSFKFHDPFPIISRQSANPFHLEIPVYSHIYVFIHIPQRNSPCVSTN